MPQRKDKENSMEKRHWFFGQIFSTKLMLNFIVALCINVLILKSELRISHFSCIVPCLIISFIIGLWVSDRLLVKISNGIFILFSLLFYSNSIRLYIAVYNFIIYLFILEKTLSWRHRSNAILESRMFVTKIFWQYR